MIVLDASALVDVVLDQTPGSWVLSQLAGEQVCAPAHQPAEVVSAVARFRRAGHISDKVARAAITEALELVQELVFPSPHHHLRAFDLQDNVRILDGLYVALAEERRCPLVTTDARLRRAAPPCEVRSPPEP